MFTDKVVVVTGGSKGIGKALTGALLKMGAKSNYIHFFYNLFVFAFCFLLFVIVTIA